MYVKIGKYESEINGKWSMWVSWDTSMESLGFHGIHFEDWFLMTKSWCIFCFCRPKVSYMLNFFLSMLFFKQWMNIRGTSCSQEVIEQVRRHFLKIALCISMCLLNLDPTAVSHFLMMCSKLSAVTMKNTFKMSYLWCGKWRLRLSCLYFRQIYVVWLMQTFKLRRKA